MNSGKTIALEYSSIVKSVMIFTNEPFVATYEDVRDVSVSVLLSRLSWKWRTAFRR